LEEFNKIPHVDFIAIVSYGFQAAATPILLYIAFNRNDYTLYESGFLRDFWHAARSAPFPAGIRPYTDQLWSCFFRVPALSLLYSRYIANSVALLLAFSAGVCTGPLAKAF